ncbi:hypothetical protein CoNPh25_CDS0015 [Staphylococcus phage S-CoN_Ph25]|nr:hypothetical protein CoNPh25_CDS0015 [Staphylococcus phage S-CoN_Ph25]
METSFIISSLSNKRFIYLHYDVIQYATPAFLISSLTVLKVRFAVLLA